MILGIEKKSVFITRFDKELWDCQNDDEESEVLFMAWYYGTYSCGHEGRVNIIGPCKDRGWKSEREFSKICPECYKEYLAKEREKRNAEAEQAAAEMELPGLIGSPAQIKWANTIRMDAINCYEKQIDKIKDELSFLGDYGDDGSYEDEANYEYEVFRASKETCLLALDYGIRTHTEARFWIDNRLSFPKIFVDFVGEYQKSVKEAIPEDIKDDIELEKAQLTIKPENASKDGVAIIQYAPDNKLTVSYSKDEEFRSILKEKGFAFDWERSAWVKEITEFTGSYDNRAADIGNSLLANGFTVRFESQKQLESAISGIFKPECNRWIKFNRTRNAFSLSWSGRNDTLYTASKKLPNSKWSNGCMTVPVEYYNQVIDFAETMGFQLSAAAQKKAEEYKSLESSYRTANVNRPVPEETSDKERLRKSLMSTGAIIEDLIDET